MGPLVGPDGIIHADSIPAGRRHRLGESRQGFQRKKKTMRSLLAGLVLVLASCDLMTPGATMEVWKGIAVPVSQPTEAAAPEEWDPIVSTSGRTSGIQRDVDPRWCTAHS